jgi:hypothetical protein
MAIDGHHTDRQVLKVHTAVDSETALWIQRLMVDDADPGTGHGLGHVSKRPFGPAGQTLPLRTFLLSFSPIAIAGTGVQWYLRSNN